MTRWLPTYAAAKYSILVVMGGDNVYNTRYRIQPHIPTRSRIHPQHTWWHPLGEPGGYSEQLYSFESSHQNMCHQKVQCTQLPVSSFLLATLCHLGITAVHPSWAKKKKTWLRTLGHWPLGRQNPSRLEFPINPTLSVTARKKWQ